MFFYIFCTLNTLSMGKTEGRRRRGRLRMRRLDGITNLMDMNEFEQAPGVGDGQGSLACSSPWGCNESDTTEWLNWTELTRAGMSSTWSFDCLSPHSRDLSLTGSLRTLSRHRNEPHQWKSAVNRGRRRGGSRSISYFSRKYIYILTNLQLDEWPVSSQQGMIFELKSHPLADSACLCSCPKCYLQSVSTLLPFLSFFN